MSTTEKYPLEIQELDAKTNDELIKCVTGNHTGFIRLGPNGFLIPSKFREDAAKIYNMPLRASDVFVLTRPRSGTTLTQEIVWLIVNDLDYGKAAEVPLRIRSPFLELSSLCDQKQYEILCEMNKGNPIGLAVIQGMFNSIIDKLQDRPSPRVLKTHLPLSLLPPAALDTAKVVYVVRDPRDAAVSLYHLNLGLSVCGFQGDFKTFWNYYINDLMNWTPYFDNLKETWAQRHHPNLLFLFYEQIIQDMPGTIMKIAKFLNKDLSDEQVTKLADHLNFDKFKNNKSVNYESTHTQGLINPETPFIRKGKSSGWREHFDAEMSEQARHWMARNLRDTDFRFPHIPSHELFD